MLGIVVFPPGLGAGSLKKNRVLRVCAYSWILAIGEPFIAITLNTAAGQNLFLSFLTYPHIYTTTTRRAIVLRPPSSLDQGLEKFLKKGRDHMEEKDSGVFFFCANNVRRIQATQVLHNKSADQTLCCLDSSYLFRPDVTAIVTLICRGAVYIVSFLAQVHQYNIAGNRQGNKMDPRKKMSFSSASIEFIYMAASPPCRAVWMCIKELGIEVDMRHIDMYKRAEHTQPWFVKVSLMRISG